MTKAQLQSLKEILAKQITLPQINYLKSLGYTPEDNILWGENLTRKQASEEIERLKEK